MAGFHNRASDLVDLEVVPYPAITLVLDLGAEPLEVADSSGHRQRGSIAAGMAPRGVRGQGREIECLQVRLSPVVAHRVLGGVSSEMGECVVALEALWGRDALRIQEQLRLADSWDDRFAIAAAALARRHDTGRAVDTEVGFAWSHLMAARGRVRVERLAAEVGWSRKRVWSRFRSQIGLTPKQAAQLIRFDQAVHRLAAGETPAMVAADSGYADQSHLHRDIMAFTGVTPTGVAAAPWLAVDDVAWATPDEPSRTS